MFEETVNRAKFIAQDSVPYIVTSEKQRLYIQGNLIECNQRARIVVEPISRNTAPAIAVAAYDALSKDKNALLLVMPSDHMIEDSIQFKRAVTQGMSLAEEGYLVTFGVEPMSPEVGFGYIKKGKKIKDNGFLVDKFIEKPEKDIARKLLELKEYYWNSGIFLFRADSYLKELKKFASSTNDAVINAMREVEWVGDTLRLRQAEFAKADSISIDYAVMEHTEKATVVPMAASWADLGSWKALYNFKNKDQKGNVFQGDVVAVDAVDCYIDSRSRLVAAIGIQGIAVIETTDAVLITPLDRSQDVRYIVDHLKKKKRPEAEISTLVYRPWGSYERLTKGERFQVKRIIVRPGEELSLQKHFHRAEHWVVVQGSAEVQLGDKTLFLTENQSTYIPVGAVHQLKNPGKIPLVIIEVQSGTYLDEDDIVRIYDKYERT